MFTFLMYLAIALLFAAMLMLSVLLSEIGIANFHNIPKYAKEGNRLAKAYLWVIWTAYSVGLIMVLMALFEGRMK